MARSAQPRQGAPALKPLLRLPLAIGLYAAALLVPAGDWRWTAAWVYLGVTVAALAGYALVVIFLQPGLIAERTKPPETAKRWDRPLAAIVGFLGPLVTLVLAGLDHRHGWSVPIPTAIRGFGCVLLVSGCALANFAVARNPFFSAVVRIQSERGHRVVDSGPYAFVRHPGYLASLITYLGGPLLLGTSWAFVPSAIVGALVIIRTGIEDRTLRRELDGYARYAQRVRSRLIPGVW